ncbi:UNVERIFIED_CONTAM: hypothetical protein DES50_106172 [Williamsia faeni]
MRHRNRPLTKITLAFAAATALVLTGCSTASTPAPTSTQPTPDVPYTTIWSAADGINLNTRPAELIRATVESGEMSGWTGVDYSFPGFADAIANATDYNGYWGNTTQPPSPDNLVSLDWRLFARHITTLSATDSHVTARVCTLHLPLVDQDVVLKSTGYTSSFGSVTQPYTVDVTLTKPASTTPGTSGQPDRAPDIHNPRALDVPDWNVFSPWTISSITLLEGVNDYYGTEPECMAWWRQKYPGWDGTSLTFGPPAPITTDTGFFEALMITRPGPPNYPEWLGPKGADA